jgi:DeoR family transcriptional regulator, L-fucose operon activator
MLQSQRKERIVSILKEKKEITVEELCNHFDLSLATIHRDLNDLEREGRVKKIHGGVLLNNIEDIETKNLIRLRTNIERKKEIASKAIEFVDNNDCLFIDNSTTCYYFSEELSQSNFQNILIITNSESIPKLFIKNNNINVISTGGFFLKDLGCFVGSNAINTIKSFNGNKFFFSMAAISPKGELSDIHRHESYEIKRSMREQCVGKICLIDSSKFGKIAQSKVFLISEVDTIITDRGLDQNLRNDFLNLGKTIIVA